MRSTNSPHVEKKNRGELVSVSVFEFFIVFLIDKMCTDLCKQANVSRCGKENVFSTQTIVIHLAPVNGNSVSIADER